MSTTTNPKVYHGTATCACGEVQFEITGNPVIGIICSCNDCRVASKYVDKKAQTAGTANISADEKGHDQCTSNCLFPLKDIKLVKGGDKIKKFRLKSKSTNIRTYTECCNTSVCMICGPFPFVKMGFGVPFNYNTLPPPPSTTENAFARILGCEALDPSKLPRDHIPNYKTLPLWFGGRIMWGVLFRSFKFSDETSRKILIENCTPAEVTEVVGKDFYVACGYPNAKF